MDWKTENQNKAMELPQKTRQKMLDLLWSGKTVGEVGDQLGIDSNVVFCFIGLNIYEKRHLRTETV